MGKSKNTKMYLKYSEWTEFFGGKKVGFAKKLDAPLPFFCCALSLQPFEDPVLAPSGAIYDIINIVPFLRKWKKDPTTGEPLSAKDLVKLKFDKNKEEKYQCPVTYKEFTPHTKIVAIKTSGNVYCYDAIENLNIKPRSWNDLITGEKFKRSDIVVIQDVMSPTQRKIADFYHLQHGLDVKAGVTANTESASHNIRSNSTITAVFGEMKKQGCANMSNKSATVKLDESGAKPKKKEKKRKLVDPQYASASFTSAGFSLKESVLVKEFEPKVTKRKGYVRLHTTCGDINLELYCDRIPLACENFLELCEKGYYNNVPFHRSIKNFMIQGGDPTGTGRGGESIWGKKFPDEFHRNLQHDGRGVLSMANSGPKTNGSQFFILYRSARHLDRKHTIFGKLVGGSDVLSAIEGTPVDGQDRPTTEIKIIKTTVFMNPFRELDQEKAEEERIVREKKEKDEESIGQWYSNPTAEGLAENTGASSVGKYLKAAPTLTTVTKSVSVGGAGTAKRRPLKLAAVVDARKKQKKEGASFGNFADF
eukprot:TRINITY_DN1601_c0_g3_i2.p1 TRINITY_DN1601_c0_g3~~TRINITY_DN1601_c0_g3_i2.p1  ORF type:complete len:534 (-),score=122.02 TRINITY_DN1601_c0_g3_i2:76-1677(-)